MESSSISWPLQVVIRLLFMILITAILSIFFDQYFFVSGGLPAYIIIGSLITIMQLIVRPLLHVLFLPLSILASLIALILINGIFLWLLVRISDELDPGIVTLSISGGLGGWIVVMLVLGISNWILKETLR